MKYLLMLFACLCLISNTACYVEEDAYADGPVVASNDNCVDFADDYGDRTVCGPHQYIDGDLYYWDAHFNVWIGPHGYWQGRVFYRGWVPGYHTWYHRGFYHAHGTFHGGTYHGGHRR